MTHKHLFQPYTNPDGTHNDQEAFFRAWLAGLTLFEIERLLEMAHIGAIRFITLNQADSDPETQEEVYIAHILQQALENVMEAADVASPQTTPN